MHDASGGLKALDLALEHIHAMERRETDAMHRAARRRDALSRAAAALGTLKELGPAPAVSGTTTEPPPAVVPGTPPAREPAPRVIAPHIAKMNEARKSKRQARKARELAEAREAKAEPPSEPAPAKKAKSPKPDPKTMPMDDLIVMVARKHSGQTVDVLANIVCAERGLAGTDHARRMRIRIDDLIKAGKLHKAPDETISV